MSYDDYNLDDPLDLEFDFDDENSIVEFLEKNLALVLINTAHLKVELEDLQKKKRQLFVDHFGCLEDETLEPFPEDRDLLPRLNRVILKAEELMGHLTKLVQARANHQKDDKDASIINLTNDECTMTPTEGQDETIDEEKKAMKETEAKATDKKAELADTEIECEANHFAMMEEIKIQNDDTKTPEQIGLIEASSKEEPSE